MTLTQNGNKSTDDNGKQVNNLLFDLVAFEYLFKIYSVIENFLVLKISKKKKPKTQKTLKKLKYSL